MQWPFLNNRRILLMNIEKIKLNVPYEKFGCKKDDFEAVLTAYTDENCDEKRPAVIVCPGGAYFFRCDREGEPVAKRYAKCGMRAFVLDYSVIPNVFPAALMELALAIKFVRENADKYGVNSDEIYICGFSAGGHLCGSMATLYNKGFLEEALETTKDMIKPNGAILSYPVITAGEYTHHDSCVNLLGMDKVWESPYYKYISLEKQVDAETAPTFIWTTFRDTLVPMENSMLFVQALRSANVDVEFHLFPVGDHGLSIASKEMVESAEEKPLYEYIHRWFDLSVNWIKNRKL